MNRLKINIDKTKVMLIGNKAQLKLLNINGFILSYDDTPLELGIPMCGVFAKLHITIYHYYEDCVVYFQWNFFTHSTSFRLWYHLVWQ